MSLGPGGATDSAASVGLPTMIASVGACVTFVVPATAPAAFDHSIDRWCHRIAIKSALSASPNRKTFLVLDCETRRNVASASTRRWREETD